METRWVVCMSSFYYFLFSFRFEIFEIRRFLKCEAHWIKFKKKKKEPMIPLPYWIETECLDLLTKHFYHLSPQLPLIFTSAWGQNLAGALKYFCSGKIKCVPKSNASLGLISNQHSQLALSLPSNPPRKPSLAEMLRGRKGN